MRNLRFEWMERERMLLSLAEFFNDVRAKAYAEGCACATRRCLDDLNTDGEWVKGYEAGLRAGMNSARPPQQET